MDAKVTVRAVYSAQFHTRVLVDRAGFDLYVFGADHGRAVTCTGACALTWPPLVVPDGERAALGRGVRAGLVGSDAVSHGERVVTYNGWPLYAYSSDVVRGVALGEGINLNGGPWDVMQADGRPLVPKGQPLLQGPGAAH